MTVLDFAHDEAKRLGLRLCFDDDIPAGEVLIVGPTVPLSSRPHAVYVHSSAARVGIGSGATCWDNNTPKGRT